MPAPTEPGRHFAIALTAAVAATTVAGGVTAATLLGWFRPPAAQQATPAPSVEPSFVYVPIAPAAPPDPPAALPADSPSERFAMGEPREHEHEHEGEREDDDD